MYTLSSSWAPAVTVMISVPRLERSMPTSGRPVPSLVSDSAILGDLEIGGVGKSWTGDEGRVDAGVANCDGTSRIVELLRDQLGCCRCKNTTLDYTLCLV
jgi:hypothetical protein